jgi:hypothetical protein
MVLATSIQKLITRALAFGTMSGPAASATYSIESHAPVRRFPILVASWFDWGNRVCVAGCQTESGSMASPASSEACLEKAREVVPAEASQRSSDLQRDRYFVYRACMHAAGLTH